MMTLIVIFDGAPLAIVLWSGGGCSDWPRPHAVFTVTTSPGHNPTHCENRHRTLGTFPNAAHLRAQVFHFITVTVFIPARRLLPFLQPARQPPVKTQSKWPPLMRSKGYCHLQPNKNHHKNNKST